MTRRVDNFGAGPATLPLTVLEEIQSELLDYRGSGRSIIESSHRAPEYAEVHADVKRCVHELLGEAGDDFEVLFFGGGARTQFGLVPMNLMPSRGNEPNGDGEGTADYVITGHWIELARATAAKLGKVNVLWSSSATGHDRVPRWQDLESSAPVAYRHYTSNNTIFGTAFNTTPSGAIAADGVPWVADMSSDLFSRPFDPTPLGLIYAGAQKNLGPAGVTLVLIRRSLLERSPDSLPEMFSYRRIAAKDSLLNTPPVFPIYVVGKVLRHLIDHGGLEGAAKRNEAKANHLYGAIDGSNGFYRGHAQPDSRSWMNVTFRLPTPELEAEYLRQAAEKGLVGLKGHRSVGGIRASIYNACAFEAVDRLVQFMGEFRQKT